MASGSWTGRCLTGAGLSAIFRRASSSPFFGREIGLMYIHAHLRYCEAAAMLGDHKPFVDGLLAPTPSR